MPIQWPTFGRNQEAPPPVLEVREYHNAGDKTVVDVAQELRARGEPFAGIKDAEWIKKHENTPEFRAHVERYKNGDQYIFFGENNSCTLQWDGKKFKLWTFSGMISPNNAPWDSQKKDPGSSRRRYVVKI